MDKVLCERPRGGWRGKRRGRIRGPHAAARPPGDRTEVLPWEDCPRFEPMSRNRGGTKWLSEHLGPLRRWLLAQAGRRWDDVHAELRANISPRNAVQLHIWQHADHYVARNVDLVDGTPYHPPGWSWGSQPRPVIARQCPVYVCPQTGIVRRTPVVARKRRRRGEAEAPTEGPARAPAQGPAQG